MLYVTDRYWSLKCRIKYQKVVRCVNIEIYTFKHIWYSHFGGSLMLLFANLDSTTSSAKVSRLSESDDTSTEHLHCDIGPNKLHAFNTIAEKPCVELNTTSKRLGKHNHPALFEYKFTDFRL